MNLRTTASCVALLSFLIAAGCFGRPDSNSDVPVNANHPTPTPTPSPTAPATSVKITNPADGGSVEQTEVVRGTSQNVPGGQVIWVVVFVHKVGRYYPQNTPAVVQPDGNWNSITYIGVASDRNLKADVLAVTADANAQNSFRNYLRDASAKGDFAGLAQLPQGATQQHGVTVTRK